MDPFALLRGGLRFDKEKDDKVRQIFEADSEDDDSTSQTLVVKTKPKGKKGREASKRRHDDRDDDDDDDEDEDDGAEDVHQDSSDEEDDDDELEVDLDEDEDEDDDDDEEEDGEEEDDSVEGRLAKAKRIGPKKVRKQHQIQVKGDDVPPPVVAFQQLSDYDVPKVVLSNLCKMHEKPTPIQMQAIPAMLKKRDVVGIAPTGSGKTCAFSFPLLANLGKHDDSGIRAVVVAPTPELAFQIKSELELLSRGSKLSIQLLTKANVGNVAKARQRSHDILVSTPRRLVYCLSKGLIDLAKVSWVVIDEADTLFENGYETQLDEILHACANREHVSLFSATMGVNLVINFDFPPSANEYIHRVGRTGRAGRTGTAITFFTTRDAPILRSIASVIRASGCDVPDWIFQLPNLPKKQRSRTVTRATISSSAAAMMADKAKRRAWAEKQRAGKGKKAKRGKKKSGGRGGGGGSKKGKKQGAVDLAE
ncbi:hypothetical protein PTSG_08940 [Salpingoeca rosetta]|uniref:ATP-dependent RNA helicase n=1 Tax=Salpingoeca rosetta (strain ATCC 50818 / BSB-021) TaxID=946362 RepID=F2ULR2_SALR5|nr:uncharacterized protein PTSG_08940 [Salpingoeca rosetta]EGD78061.1 hypothetical protein PTSG_08940 [Salpingoeca rosetta]|eukprot:XP_004989737.1 hypothetical protein PTSG_08940 [Salpingoeca rosetta]